MEVDARPAWSPARTPGKRGRKQALPDPAAGPVAAFAHRLGTLKLAAGDPSYERMRIGLGAIASKSALSAAVRGQVLPSWETTWEFVRCLAGPDADLEVLRRDWRPLWEAARTGAEDASSDGASSPVAPSSGPARLRGSERRLLALGAAVGVLAGGLLWLLVAASGPSQSSQPPIAGDDLTFVRDVTIPDGTVVRVGERFVKTWELRNTGTVAWVGRFLMRLPAVDGAGCRTAERVPLPSTAPGDLLQVTVIVDAPRQPAACKVYWKVVDGAGRPYFPLKRPLFFEVTVTD